MKMTWIATVSVASILTVGCGKQQTGSVAVVDLDKVASALGRDAVMLEHLQKQQDGLNQKLVSAKESFEQQLTESFEKLPEEPSEEQTQQILQMKQKANIQLASYKQQATNALGQLKNSAIVKFRKEAMPVARRIATEQGFSVVLTTNDTVVFTFEDSADITDEVIAELRKTAPPATLPSAASAPELKQAPESSAAGNGDTASSADSGE